MKFLKFLSVFLTASVLSSPAIAQEKKDDKIATVNMQLLVNDYHKSKTIRESFKKYEEGIRDQDKTRIEKIQAVVEEAKKLQEDAKDPSLSSEKRNEFFTAATNKQREAQGLQQARIDWLKRKQSALNEKASMEFSEIRKEIMKIVQELGEEEEYDYIFDRSGASGAGVAIMVYTKDATDLTGVLLERINKDAPKEEEKEGE